MSEGRLTGKTSTTEEEVREIAERRNLVGFPHLALVRERLSVKAKNEPKFRFYNLYGHVVETETLKCAWQNVKANKGAAGVDGVTIEDIEQSEGGVDGFIAEIQRELHEKTYRASPVRRKYIEKRNGKLRPLGIPTVKDRVVQNAVLLIVEPIFEADFHDCSYGFRPNRSAQQAVDSIAGEIKAGKSQVYDADLSSYFDTIPHDKLFLALRKRVTDGSVLSLIRQWLKATIVEPSGVKKNPRGKGTPQGGVISPLLSNIYLHWFETCAMLVAKATNQVMSIVRYADDFVILARKWADGFVQRIECELENRFGLVVNREKTRLLDMGADKSALVFLGYEFRYVRDRRYHTGRKYLEWCPSNKSVKSVCRKIKEETMRRKLLLPVEEVVKRLNLVLDGWGRYFKCGYPSRRFAKVNEYVRYRLHKFLNRKSQRRYRLKYAETYCGEYQRLGLIVLARKRYR
jgi:RNA-directed DNA polymerase